MSATHTSHRVYGSRSEGGDGSHVDELNEDGFEELDVVHGMRS